MKKRYFDWVYEFPKFVIIRKEGYYYSARNESAEVLHDLLGFRLGIQGTSVVTGCPVVEPIIEALAAAETNYIVIEDNEIVHKEEFENSNFSIDEKVYKPVSGLGIPDNIASKEIELIEICDALLMGVDPFTGEILSEDHLVNSDSVQEIISLAKKTIYNKAVRESKKPEQAGAKWSEEEEVKLKDEYKAGLPIKEIAKLHNRTEGAIRLKLIKIFPDVFK